MANSTFYITPLETPLQVIVDTTRTQPEGYGYSANGVAGQILFSAGGANSYWSYTTALNVNSAIHANNSTFLGGVAAIDYQRSSGLADNVARMAANSASYIGTLAASLVVSNTQLQANLSSYQTISGLAANIALLAANSATYLSGNSAANLIAYAANAYSNAIAYAANVYANAIAYATPAISGLSSSAKQVTDLQVALRGNSYISFTPYQGDLVENPNSINALLYDTGGGTYIKGDGVTNDAPAINALLSVAAAAGKSVRFPAGTYRLNSQINMVSNLRVICDPNAVFVRYFTTTGSFAMLTQSSFSTKIANVYWYSGTLKSADTSNTGWGGNAVGFYGDDITLDTLRIDGYGTKNGGGRAVACNGNNIRIFNPYFFNVAPYTGCGGIRVTGGSGFLCVGGYVESGDDVFQFVPAIPGALPTADTSIDNGMYIGCVGYSYGARLIAVVLGNQTQEVGVSGFPACTASIRDCSFIGIKGKGVARPAIIQNSDSSGKIQRITIHDCTLGGQSDDAVSSSGGAVYLTGWQCSGGIEEIEIVNCSVTTPDRTAIYVDGFRTNANAALTNGTNKFNVRNVRVNGGRFDAPTSGAYFVVQMNGANGFSMRDATLYCANNEAFQIGTGSNTDAYCYNVLLDNLVIANVGTNQYGVKLQLANNAIIKHIRLYPGATETNACGIYVGPSTNRVLIKDNDLSYLNGSLTINNLIGSNCIISDNRGYTSQDVFFARKTGDEARSSNTTLTADSELKLVGLEASTTYEIFSFLRWNQGATANGGFQAQFAIESSSGAYDFEYTSAPSLTAARSNESSTQQPTITTALNERIMTIWGILRTGTSTANLVVNWAQQNSSTQSVTLRQNSSLRAQKRT